MPTRDYQLYSLASKCLFAERMQSQAQCMTNGGILYNGASIDNGIATFDGINDYINYSGVFPFKSATSRSFTFSVDVKTTISQSVGVAGTGYGGAGIGAVQVEQSITNFNAYISRVGGLYVVPFGSGLNDGKLHRLVVTRNGANIYSYLDGIYVATTNIGATKTVYGNNFLLGARNTSTTFWNGQIGRVLFNETAWDTEDVAYDYANTLWNYEDRFVLNLPFHDKIGTANPYSTTDISRYGRVVSSSAFPDRLTHTNGYNFPTAKYMSHTPIDYGTTHSFSMWLVKSVDIAQVVYGGDLAPQSYAFYAGGVTDYYQAAGSAVSFSSPLQIGKTSHIVITREGTTVKFYHNGELYSTQVLGANNSLVLDTVGAFNTFANSLNAKLYSLQSTFDCLSSLQVKDLYSKGPSYRGDRA